MVSEKNMFNNFRETASRWDGFQISPLVRSKRDGSWAVILTRKMDQIYGDTSGSTDEAVIALYASGIAIVPGFPLCRTAKGV